MPPLRPRVKHLRARRRFLRARNYDVLGRETSDQVTTLGTNVDGTVRRIDTAYDGQGNAYLTTSYSTTAGTTIVNQVERLYDGFGELANDYQSVSGAVVVGTTPDVQYTYTEAASADNNRLVSITYPGGYVLTYNYSTGVNNTISRLSSLSDSSNTLESYKYLGLDTFVERDHPQTNINLTYISQTGGTGDAGDKYVGLDRFGRVVDQNWYDTATSMSVDEFQYGYDQDGNVLWKLNTVNTAYSELYTYDNLNQVATMQRGTLNSGKTGLTGGASYSQSWTPDALGNFTTVTTNGTAVNNTVNQQNEYTTTGVTYDADGNTTADGTGETFVYDAWNRLVDVKSGGSTIAAYGYDGLGRKLVQTDGSITTDLYYSDQWQVLEERIGGVVQARNVWSPVFQDALVLRDQSSLHNVTLDQRLYVEQDTDYNVTSLVISTGSVVERYVYNAYGKVSYLTATWGSLSGSAYGAEYLYQGQRADATTSLYDSRNRAYDPALSRFLQTDPSGLRPDDNDYRYERDNSINGMDPTGLTSMTPALWRSMPHPEQQDTSWFGNGPWWSFDDITRINHFRDTDPLGYLNSYYSGLFGGLNDNFVQPVVRTGQFAYDVPHAIDPGYQPSNPIFRAYLNHQIGYGRAWLGITGDAATTVMLIDAAVNFGTMRFCFPAGTPVATPNGLIAINRLKPGSAVWGYDFAASQWKSCIVLQTFCQDFEGTSVSITAADETIDSTLLHPYWVVRGERLEYRQRRPHLSMEPHESATVGRWVDAGDVCVGDELLLRDGRVVPVARVVHSSFQGKVYNIEVGSLQCYAVGESGFLVHNANAAETTFVDEMSPTEAARYREYWGGQHNISGGQPYGIPRTVTKNGQLKTITTNDQYGRPYRQYGLREGELPHEHGFIYPQTPQPGTGWAPIRGPQRPIGFHES